MLIRKVGIVVLMALTLISCSDRDKDQSHGSSPLLLSIEMVRKDADRFSNRIINVYGYLSSLRNGDRLEVILLPSEFEKKLIDSAKQQLGMRIDLWENANVESCLGLAVKVSGLYSVEFEKPNSFYFDAISAEVIQDIENGVPCGMERVSEK